MLLLELSTSLEQHMRDKGYSASTIRSSYRYHWAGLRMAFGNVEYSPEFPVSYTMERFGRNLMPLSPSEMTSKENDCRRALYALDCFSKTGTVCTAPISGVPVRQPLSDDSETALKLFDEYLEKRGYATTTRKVAHGVIHAMLLSRPLETMDGESVLSYIASLSVKAKETVMNERKYIKQFLTFAAESGLLPENYGTKVVFPKKLRNTEIPSVYSPQEVVVLLNYLRRKHKNGLRDYAIGLLIAVYGYRAEDIASMRLDSVQLESEKLTIRQSKNGMRLEHRLTELCGCALADYLLHERPSESQSPYVFLQRNGEPLRSSTISGMIARGFLNCGLNLKGRKHGSHCLRHSLAANMIAQGVNITDVSHTLGHESVETTQTYYAKVDILHLRMCELEVPDDE